MSSPKGTYDITPADDAKAPWRKSKDWDAIEAAAIETARLFGCQRVRTPIFEHLELFTRSVGESSDIVSKEMYAFEDRSGRKLALRPEGTASVVRAAIDARLFETPFTRLFYIGPMFRYERPQAGRFRQHRQLGAEFFGSSNPAVDVEAIEMMLTFYAKIGLKNLVLNINSLGTKECQKAYGAALREYLQEHRDDLSEDSQRRLQTNPLRILDSKQPKDQAIVRAAPKIIDVMNAGAKEHFTKVQELLESLSIPFVINTNLVRGLDYYTHTVFEVTSDALGAQNAIGGGGRYDKLVHEIGGPDIPAVGFATGLERVITTALAQGVSFADGAAPKIVLFSMEGAESVVFTLASELRKNNVRVVIERKSKRVGDAVSRANAMGASFFCAIGGREIETGFAKVKDLEKHEETEMEIELITSYLVKGPA